jgi:hypothetical protein
LYLYKGFFGSFFYGLGLVIMRFTDAISATKTMPYQYSLFVNGRHLGPYERRMIVGMRVKQVVADDQLVQRNDGLDMTVADLLEDRDEITPKAAATDANVQGRLDAPSSGMWPQFSVRYGGGPMKPGALGFSGAGQISYQGDALHIKGNRRNLNLGMSRQVDRLPVGAIASSSTDGCFIEFLLKPGQPLNTGDQPLPVRIECVTEQEASELWELINMLPGEMPNGLSYAKTTPSDLY